MFEFCIPHGLKYTRVAEIEGALHDRITLRSHGELSELIMFTHGVNGTPAKTSPEDWPSAEQTPGETVSVSQWRCSEGDGRDFRLHHNGRHWRLLTFPLGFAEYKDVPPSAAERFDKVIDSLCCQPLPPN